MPIPAASASRGEAKRTGRPSSRISPTYSGCTPAIIFIKVDLPAPFSPTRPWISPPWSEKSTSRKATAPPNALEIPVRSSSAGTMSDQEMLLHPHHPRRVRLRHDRPVDDDVLRNAARPGLFTGNDGRHAGDDRAAVDAAGRV